jgi:flavin reductase (DIM6/NTAB) family NADH-FMN oxidoreductase RutF
MVVDYADKAFTQSNQLMAQTIIPRPIAWVLTQNAEGTLNIAPFSYFMGLSAEPPTMVVSVGYKSDGSQKDTLKNLRETKKCTICMVDEPLLEKMHFSSKELDSALSEAKEFNIDTKNVVDGFPPMVEGAPSAFFCEYYQEIDLKNAQNVPLIVEIKAQYIDDNIVTGEEKITLDYEPLVRVGKSYALLGKKITPPSIP